MLVNTSSIFLFHHVYFDRITVSPEETKRNVRIFKEEPLRIEVDRFHPVGGTPDQGKGRNGKVLVADSQGTIKIKEDVSVLIDFRELPNI